MTTSLAVAAAGAGVVGDGSARCTAGAGAGAGEAANAAGVSVRRLKWIFDDPSTRLIAVRSYRFIRRTSLWITRTSKGGLGSVGFSGMLTLRGRYSSAWSEGVQPARAESSDFGTWVRTSQ